jgi:hypothetical protein
MAKVCPIDKLANIVLASDGSIYSEGAVREAIGLAKKCNTRLIAMAVVEANPEYASIAPDLLEKEELEAKKILEAIEQRASAEGVTVETVAHEGENAWQYIINEAEKQNAEMIVMGRRGRTGMAKVAMGSVTAKVVGHASCDVLVVPKAARIECDTILIATDGSSHSDAAAREGIAMAEKCDGRVIAFSSVSSDSDKAMAEANVSAVRQKAEDAGVAVTTKTAVGKSYMEIIKAAKDEDADMIVVGCHGRTGLAHLLMGSVAERVIGLADTAVLVACG